MSAVMAPRDYVELPWRIPPEFRVLDIGPGAYPFKRADVYLDHSEEILAPLKEEGRTTILGHIESGLPEIRDHEFDYVWCSHVLEHVNDPVACAATLSRIARSGTVVMPSAVKESIFNFEESDHKWFVLPHPNGGPTIFIRHKPAFMKRIIDKDIQKVACFMYRTGTDHDMWEHKYCREWFKRIEPDLDIVVHWSGQLELMVIG